MTKHPQNRYERRKLDEKKKRSKRKANEAVSSGFDGSVPSDAEEG